MLNSDEPAPKPAPIGEDLSADEAPAEACLTLPAEESVAVPAGPGDFAGTPEERNEMVCEHLHLVAPIARKFREAGARSDDLIQVGYIGLIKAVNSFKGSYNVKFSTYATHFITGEIRHYLRDKIDTIKRPRWLSGLNRRLAAFLEQFMQREKRLPTLDEIAKGINVSEEGVVEILRARNLATLSSLDDPGGNDSIATDKIRSLHYETFRLPIEESISLTDAMEKLKSVEQNIVYLFFYQDLTQTEIARNMGLSQKKVSRVLQKALEKMRGILKSDS